MLPMEALLAFKGASKENKLTCCVAVAVAGLGGQAVADILNVPADFPTIQAAINAAIAGDEVVVADGEYTGAGNKNLDFHGKLITVRSASGDSSRCTIDCQGAGRGFIFQTGETSQATVDGFTITNGFDGFFFGGAIHIFASSPTISNCILAQNNAASGGGGIYIAFGSTPIVTGCVFNNNMGGPCGGAILISNSSPTIANCAFAANSATGGGAIFNDAGNRIGFS